MPPGPFPFRSPEPYGSQNLVPDSGCGYDKIFTEFKNDTDAPLPLSPEILSGQVKGLKPKPESDADGNSTNKSFDLLIVGAGLSGCVIAERCAEELGMTSLILDKRDHIGGNCYDYVTKEGIRASKYGAHLFHTKYDRVWEYMQRFSEWIPFDHRVKGLVSSGGAQSAAANGAAGKTGNSTVKPGVKELVPIPPVWETVNKLFGESITSEQEMEKYYERVRVYPKVEEGESNDNSNSKDGDADPSKAVHGGLKNSEDAALSRVGPDLYEAIFLHYTKKQWDKYPKELDSSVMMRLPCRTNTDERYFPDQYQALPSRGYTRIFENMVLFNEKITIRCNCDFFAMKERGELPEYKFLIYTGPIDQYFSSQGMPKLEYRSIYFEESFIEEPDEKGTEHLKEINANDTCYTTDSNNKTNAYDRCGYSNYPPQSPSNQFFQPVMVVNYPGPDVPYTRIVEYKHVPNQTKAVKEGKVKGSLIAKEYSSATGDPYYPVPNPENRALYEKYKELADREEKSEAIDGKPGVAFVGRLASYKYFNMDQAVLNALEMYDNLKETGRLGATRVFGTGNEPKY